MPRFLAVACWLSAILLPASTGALGLGEIELKSALNEPFVADIPLQLDDPAELNSVSVFLAPVGTFQRYGISFPAFLSDFQFSLSTDDSGNGTVQVRSVRPVAEPFITLLLEVEWPSGKLLREYTVLLDSPVNLEQESEPLSQDLKPSASEETSLSLVDSTYGPVKRRQTLWGLAQELRPDSSVDINHMMLALYRTNPSAFVNNINQLKEGAILRIPDADEIGAMTPSEVFAAVQRQHDEWRASELTGQVAQLRLVLPADAVLDSGSGAAVSDEAFGTAETDLLESELAASLTGELDSELEESSGLVEIEDPELEALQDRFGELDELEAEAIVGVEVGEFSALDVGAPSALIEVEKPLTEGLVDDAAEEAAETLTTEAGEVPGGELILDRAIELVEEYWMWAAGLLVAMVLLIGVRRRLGGGVAKQDQGSTADDTFGGGWDDTDSDAYGPIQRLHAPAADGESFVVDEATDSAAEPDPELDAFFETVPDPVDAIPAELEVPVEGVGEVEDILEGTFSMQAPINLDQADPVAEAEFHMANGLYNQAADLLVQALQADPDNRGLRVKLLEVYFVWENKEVFLTEARILREMIANDADPAWNKVLIMGKQICPDDELFSAVPVGTDVAELMDVTFLSEEAGMVGVGALIEESGLTPALEVGADPGPALNDLDELENDQTVGAGEIVDDATVLAGDETVGQPQRGTGDAGEQPQPDQVAGVVELDELSETNTIKVFGLEDLSDEPTMTEVGTKLDLARAYIDMGDPDVARSILKEVLGEGDDSQQQEARQLLDELID